MKLSDSQEIFKLLKEIGIHKNPERLTQAELKELSKNPTVRQKLLGLLSTNNRNLYQELEMDSPYVNIHRDISYEPENLQLHSHSFYEIIYCESGNIQYLIANKRYYIHTGDIILLPPGISHRPLFHEEMTNPFSRIVLWISNDFLHSLEQLCPNELLSKIHNKEHFLLRTEGTSYQYLATYFKQSLQEANDANPMWNIALYGNTTVFLAHLGRALLSTQPTLPIQKLEDIDKIITYIEDNYANKITLTDTAKLFHISTSTLSKMFYQKLGISFYHFVTQRRLINAKLKIEKGDSMEDIALTCGFCDYSAFYRAFKKKYGISPREYKKLI